jgi:hypothetical protein
VGGPTCEIIEIQGHLIKKGLVEPWIINPMAAVAVDCAVSPAHAHGSTVDQAKGYPPDLIRTVRGRSHGPGREHATRGGGHAGTERGQRRAAALHRRSLGKGFPMAKMSTGECYA